MTQSPVSVSVIIPCYQCDGTVERALKSVFKQTSKPIEVILVDDGSPSSTKLKLKQLSLEYPAGWIRILTMHRNEGVASARNAGWSQAVGDYVAFLDADDAWHPHKLQHQHGFMQCNPHIDVSGHGFAYSDLSVNVHIVTECRPVAARIVRPWMVVLKNPFVTPSIMLKRRIELRFESDQRHMEDHLLLMRLALRGATLAYLPCQLASLFKASYGEGGLSGDMRAMYAGEQFNLRKLVADGDLPHIFLPLLKGYLLLKYIRRRLIVWFRRHKINSSSSAA